MNCIHVVSVSGGLPSACVAKLVTDMYGRQDVHLIFADTGVEDEDNYRFLNDLAQLLSVPITRISAGKGTPLQLAERANFIYNSRTAGCTAQLKVKPIQNYVKALIAKNPDKAVVVYLGMDAKDRAKGRLVNARRNWSSLGVRVVYPLIEWGRDINPYAVDLGIAPPRTYALGFSNANCLQQGCVKQGAKGWLQLLRVFPERFWKTAVWENDMRVKLGNHAFLKKVKNGVTRPYPLSELLADYLAALDDERQMALLTFQADLEDECVSGECGISGAIAYDVESDTVAAQQLPLWPDLHK